MHHCIAYSIVLDPSLRRSAVRKHETEPPLQTNVQYFPAQSAVSTHNITIKIRSHQY